MKHIKHFENKKHTINSINKIIDEHKNLLSIVNEYISWKEKLNYPKAATVTDIKFDVDNHCYDIIYEEYDPGRIVYYTIDNIDELINFINNPKMFKETDKFNL